MIQKIRLNPERMLGEIEDLSRFSDVPAPAVTRILYSPTDMAARRYLKQLAESAGLKSREDALGNWFVRLDGSEPGLPAVATGSHIDAIPHAGRYDGVVGVLGGLEALRSISESGIRPRRSLELIMFTSEEPTRFGLGCLGSRALVGLIATEELQGLRDVKGVSLEQARTEAGFSMPLENLALAADSYSCFVELHIEQGPFLEAADAAIGIVTGIVACTAIQVVIQGEGGHAGTVFMQERHDALVAAAELIVLVERSASEHGGGAAVATVGKCVVHPGASNSIPNSVEMTIDVRDRQSKVRDEVVNAIRRGLDSLAEARQVRFSWKLLYDDPACQSDSEVLQAIDRNVDDLGYSKLHLLSRACHDTLFMAQKFPTAMIFIPSHEGFSHRPEEYSSPRQIMAGVETLAATLVRLATK